MFGLRQKLIFGFGGLLLILLVMSGVGIGVLEQSRTALDRFLYENWRSVEYGHGIIDALGRLNEGARLAVEQGPADDGGGAGQGAMAEATRAFEQNLSDENHNLTLPGEDKLAQELNAAWGGDGGYRALHARIMDVATAPEVRKGLYGQLQQVSARLGQTANDVIKLNFDNMKPVEGKAKAIADSTTRIMILWRSRGC
jgi:two-component system, NtrC family, sensor histidine kinase KinB